MNKVVKEKEGGTSKGTFNESESEAGWLTGWIVCALVLGIVAGLALGPNAVPLGLIGKVFIQLIKAFALPLVFLSIVEAVLSTHIRVQQAGRLLIIVLVNGSIAAFIGLGLSNLFLPGKHLDLNSADTGSTSALQGFTPKPLSFSEVLTGYVPNSIVQPFTDNNVIAVVLIALLFGVALRKAVAGNDHDSETARHAVQIFLRSWSLLLGFLTKLVPLAVFAVTARTVGEFGFRPFIGLAWYVVIGITGLILHAALVYPLWIRWVGGIDLKKFARAAREPVAVAFGTNSSLATLPTTLRSLDSLGIDKSSSRLGACVGTNFNNDGILLYEAMAVLFVAQAYGIDMSIGQQISAALLCVVAAVGVAGVPEAGVVSLSLVLTTVGLPLEILPLLLTVDWLIARMRSVVNVLSDMTVSTALHGMRGKVPGSASDPTLIS